MATLVWSVLPVVVALLVGAAIAIHDHRPRIRGSFEEIEQFRHFREALKRRNAEPTAFHG